MKYLNPKKMADLIIEHYIIISIVLAGLSGYLLQIGAEKGAEKAKKKSQTKLKPRLTTP